MRRVLKYVALAVVLLVAGIGVLLAATFLGRQPIPDGLEVNGVRIVKDGMVSICVLPVGGDGVALFDAGNDKTGKAILRELARRGLGPGNVKAVLLTHGHPDHVAAVPLFANAQVMALAEEVEVAEGRVSPGGPVMKWMPVQPTGVKISRTLHDGETVDLGPEKVQVFAVPGHTPGSAAYLVRGVLLLGDAADAGSDGRVSGSAWLFSKDQGQDRRALHALARRLGSQGGVESLIFAHSGALRHGLEPMTVAARDW